MSDESVRPPQLLELPSYLAGNVARIGHELLLDVLEAQGLRLGHYAILTALMDFGPLAQYELADRLAVDRSHVVARLDHLEGRELVARERDARDRRRQVVTLTAPGRRLQRRLAAAALRSQATFLNVLSPEEQATLVALLRRVLVAHDAERLAGDVDRRIAAGHAKSSRTGSSGP